jgi:hypothetical protein
MSCFSSALENDDLLQVGLIKGEKVIRTTGFGVTLTNYRIKQDLKKSAGAMSLNISLDSVSSCGLVTQSKWYLLILAVFVAIAAVVTFKSNNYPIGITCASVTVVLILAYFVTRRACIAVCSNGGQHIFASTTGESYENIRDFIDAVMEEKLKFIGRFNG